MNKPLPGGRMHSSPLLPLLLRPDLVHLLHALLELLVLALLVAVSLVTAPPRQVVVVVSALVEGDEQVGALVAVGEREFGRAHLGSRCLGLRAIVAHSHGILY